MKYSNSLGALLCFSLLIWANLANAQSAVFTVNAVHIDAARHPRTIFDKMKTKEAQVLLAAFAQSIGVSPTIVAGIAALLPGTKSVGNESFYAIGTGDGYVYCASRVNVISVFGNSTLVARSRDDRLDIYTDTPQPNFPDGQSSVELEATIIGVLPSMLGQYRANGTCRPPGNNNAVIFSCRRDCPGEVVDGNAAKRNKP